MLACPTCGATLALPKHCGKPMQQTILEGRESLACWMGPECGRSEMPQHCGTPMSVRS